MPVVDVHPDELRRLTGHTDKTDDELRDDLFALGLEYEGETQDGAFELELASDRLDRLSPTGVARSLRYQYGDDRGVYIPDTTDSDWTITVDDTVPDQRPYVTGAVVRGLDLDEATLDAIIQLQEKLHATMGRDRAKGAIGIHDLTMLKGEPLQGQDPDETPVDAGKSITYRGIDPTGDRFVPLDGDTEMTPADVLTDHHIGRDYADLVDDYDTYPAIYDDIGLFSFPPVVNGQRTELSTDSRDVFIELTGTDQWTIDRMCTIICYAFDARGGQIETVDVAYGDDTIVRPDLEPRVKHVTHDRIETTLGTDITGDEVVELLERSGHDVEVMDDWETYAVTIPPYRVDVLHPVDIVDDLGRAYGFNTLVPRYPDVGTVGGRHERSRHERALRNRLTGLGFEDLLNFVLTSHTAQYDAMNLDPTTDAYGAHDPVTITEPYSEAYEIVRTWVLPSLLEVLSNNTHRRYPQDLAEIGTAAHEDHTHPTNVAERRSLAAVLARHDASYETVRSRLQALTNSFDTTLDTPPTTHPSFIDGRVATIELDGEPAGVIGELHPEVLVAHDLELPVAAFELEAAALR